MWIIKHTNVSKASIFLLLISSITMFNVLLTNNIIIFILLNVVYFALNAIIVPVIQDLIASRSNNKNTSIVMGFYNAIKSLGGILGALIAGFLYVFNPRLPFISGLITFILATILSVYYYILTKKKEYKLLFKYNNLYSFSSLNYFSHPKTILALFLAFVKTSITILECLSILSHTS